MAFVGINYGNIVNLHGVNCNRFCGNYGTTVFTNKLERDSKLVKLFVYLCVFFSSNFYFQLHFYVQFTTD